MGQAFAILSRVHHPPILLGTSSFTAAGWNGSFYPREVLVDCNAEFSGFLETMDILGPKLGPIVFQFPLFQRNMILRNLRRSTYSSRFSLP